MVAWLVLKIYDSVKPSTGITRMENGLGEEGKGVNEIISRTRRHKGLYNCGEAFLKSDRE